MSLPTVDLRLADLQLAAARDLRWYPGSVTLESEHLVLEGWALAVWEEQRQLRFLLNGEDFDEVQWPMASPDLLGHFPDVPSAGASRFRARQRLRGDRPWFPGGWARFNVTAQFGEHGHSYLTAWFLADPTMEPDLPSGEQIARVIGHGDAFAFRLGGATSARRIDAYLRHRFDRPLSSFASVLDWGCGAGRIARYLYREVPSLTGVDIDANNIAGCQTCIPSGRFLSIDEVPPMPFADAEFDLVIGLSVLTHLDEASQRAWLAEIRRVLRPGGLAILSVQGPAQTALYQGVQQQIVAHRDGIHVAGKNSQLDKALGKEAAYFDVVYSRDYIYAHWSTWLEVLEIVPALAADQDAVVMRRR